MTSSNFRQLCAELCRAAVTPLPDDFGGDGCGITAFVITVNGIETVVRHDPARSPAVAMLEVAFGSLPREDPLAACRALMEVNGLMLWNRACSLGRDRATGQIALQYAFPLRDACAAELYACIRELAEVANGWREHRFLGPLGSSPLALLIASSGNT